MPTQQGPALTELLSRLLVAFTIEFDHAAEERIEHRTSVGTSRGAGGVWLVSQAMWANFLQFVPAGGVPLRQVAALARITNLAGLTRWRYVRLDPPATPGRRPAADAVIELTPAGTRAAAVFTGLADEIEQRWRTRFGDESVTRLSDALAVFETEPATPYLPVVGYADAMRSDHARGITIAAPGRADLSVRLSHVVFALTVDYEANSRLSLPMGADVLVHLDERGVPVPDLVAASGISREAINSLVGFLQRQGLGTIESDNGMRVVRLTDAGMAARAAHLHEIGAQQRRYRQRFGDRAADEARTAALAILDARHGDGAPTLAEGLRPPDGGWRTHPRYVAQTTAFLADPWRLPAQPAVLHRGGYPDGS